MFSNHVADRVCAWKKEVWNETAVRVCALVQGERSMKWNEMKRNEIKWGRSLEWSCSEGVYISAAVYKFDTKVPNHYFGTVPVQNAAFHIRVFLKYLRVGSVEWVAGDCKKYGR